MTSGPSQPETFRLGAAMVAVVREHEVRDVLPLPLAIRDLAEALRRALPEAALSAPRARIAPRREGAAWMHTLRAAYPVIPAAAELGALRHLNLVGSNHRQRREIDPSLARPCLPPEGFLAVDDPAGAAQEAGNFLDMVPQVEWERVPSLHDLMRKPTLPHDTTASGWTTFKSVGSGLMDLIVAGVALRRLGLLPVSDDSAPSISPMVEE